MSSINSNNLTTVSSEVLKAGQRVVIINGVAHASGVGGVTPPSGSGGSSGGSGGGAGEYTKQDVVKYCLIFD